ncbi:sensor histidine kinase [Gracilibacillus timonensis]|uniref:sensor histidine kinase n=1 Tax=Gracilibacillus timonensis TaxID=1816696 RepID=UPI000A4B09A9|nr:sensor histidine kinase [Gracilibacillus timonensis]
MNLLKKWNTLRNQLLVVYLMVMFIILIVVSAITYVLVADLLQDNAEEQIRQTAIESSGRYDSLMEQVNTVTRQVITNEELQSILYRESNGIQATFNERQSLMSTINFIQANADGIYSVEIYGEDYRRVIPIDSTHLMERVEPQWIDKADEAMGQLVWMGEDPLDANYFLVGKRINLMDDNFKHAGYNIARVNRNYFQLNETHNEKASGDYAIIVDEHNQIVTSDFPYSVDRVLGAESESLSFAGEEFMLVQHTSQDTGWTVYLLTPVGQLTDGMSSVQAGIIFAGIIGLIIFFIASFFLSTFITRPITRLTQTMREAGKGVMAPNPETPSTNEINELNQTYNQLAAETNYLVQMVYEKEIMKNRTELKALQAQIHPHFLFNTLDALYWSLDEREEEDLADVVLAMSHLFRYTITRENQDEWVTIKEELDHIDQYMQIMKMRFGERLRWEKKVDAASLQVRIPKLMLQPMVENAILHGAGNMVSDCNVTIWIEEVEQRDSLRIKVIDNGPGMDDQQLAYVRRLIDGDVNKQKGLGMALQNVQKRLELFYGEKENKLHIHSQENKGTIVSFDIPRKGANDTWHEK